jgi:hypothetical protein
VPSDGRYGSIYEADFKLADELILEIVLFADESGNLAYVEIDCCANSCAVPDLIEAHDQPFRTNASAKLLY